jgi:hypothetical protein
VTAKQVCAARSQVYVALSSVMLVEVEQRVQWLMGKELWKIDRLRNGRARAALEKQQPNPNDSFTTDYGV